MVVSMQSPWDELTGSQKEILRLLATAPLASAGDIAGFLSRTDSWVHSLLRALSKAGLVDATRLGVIGSAVDRWFIPEAAQLALGLTGKTWHQPGCLGRLVDRLIAVEWLYRAAVRVDGLGEFQEWQWVDGVSFDAATRYAEGWVAWFWLGSTKVDSRMAELFEQFGADLHNLRYGGSEARPSWLGILVWDRWQAETVLRCARQYGIEDWVQVWDVQDDTWTDVRGPRPGAGWIWQPPYRRNRGWRGWERKVEGSLWSERGRRNPVQWLRWVRPTVKGTHNGVQCVGLFNRAIRILGSVEDMDKAVLIIEDAAKSAAQDYQDAEAAEILGRVPGHLRSRDGTRDMVRVLLWAMEWPGVTVSMLQAVLREKRSSRRAYRACIRLLDLGLLVRWRDGRANRYRIREDGIRIVAGMDRTAWETVWKRIQMDRWSNRKGFQAHEYGLLDLIHQFVAAGCSVANGWRMWEPLGTHGGIAPDAAVYLKESPFGAGWHYVEYERRVKSAGDMGKKLRGYESIRRRDDFPLLMVCANQLAEENAQNWALENRVRLATTTMERLKEHGAVGNDKCWMALCHPAPMDDRSDATGR